MPGNSCDRVRGARDPTLGFGDGQGTGHPRLLNPLNHSVIFWQMYDLQVAKVKCTVPLPFAAGSLRGLTMNGQCRMATVSRVWGSR